MRLWKEELGYGRDFSGGSTMSDLARRLNIMADGMDERPVADFVSVKQGLREAADALADKDAVIARLESELDAAQTNWSNETLELGAEIERLQTNESALMKSLDTVQVIRMAEEHEIERQQALIDALTGFYNEWDLSESCEICGKQGPEPHSPVCPVAKVESLLEQQNETTD